MSRLQILQWFLRIGGLLMLGNAAWMLADAFHWFATIPAGLTDTGHPNGHFIRDVGLAYAVFGAASLWCAAQPAQRRAVFVCIAVFMSGHAAGHVAEILLGVLPSSHWLIDLPLVLLPGLIYGFLLIPGVWRYSLEDRVAS